VLGETTRDRRAERREATIQEILDAAWGIVRDEGLAALNLRELARRVGMQPPSLYVYFDSKNAIYDAMFAEGYHQLADAMAAYETTGDLRGDLRAIARTMVEFSAEDPARAQLMFLRVIPGFEPSPESYAVSVARYEDMRAQMASYGITEQADLDLWTALTSGLANQQSANDPGGDRWIRLIDDAVDMYIAQVAPKRKGKK
jgi:AcrR family transcriptional regulator